MLYLNKLNTEPEIFESIQGEGRNVGKEVLFIRLKGCSLHCGFCDTKDSWDPKSPLNEGKVPMTVEELSARIENSERTRVVITGGEPLLQQKELVYLPANRDYEIETSGTIMPSEAMIAMVNQWNISPKLSNSGNSRDERFKPQILRFFSSLPNADFKFVVGEEGDIEEVLDIVNEIGIKPEHVWLMPLGQTLEELKKSEPVVNKLSSLYGFQKTDRLHIKLFGSRRGV